MIELFQSQGCSSCPPANAALNAVAGRPDVLALSFAVTYWDQLGWKDKFASPTFTARQWDSARAGGRKSVATPQIIFNSKDMMLGGNRQHFDQLIASSGPIKGGPSIEPAGRSVVIGAGTATAPATAWLVRYDPRVREVAISAGENDGKTVPHRDIVTDLVALGTWSGRDSTFALTPNSDPGLRTAILLQRGKGGPIIAARKL